MSLAYLAWLESSARGGRAQLAQIARVYRREWFRVNGYIYGNIAEISRNFFRPRSDRSLSSFPARPGVLSVFGYIEKRKFCSRDENVAHLTKIWLKWGRPNVFGSCNQKNLIVAMCGFLSQWYMQNKYSIEVIQAKPWQCQPQIVCTEYFSFKYQNNFFGVLKILV